ncbi:MAG: efflux RND transporter periplasmic adaptor subunit [Fidelibacterota bacterium]
MKRTLILISILTFLFLSCNNQENQTAEEEETFTVKVQKPTVGSIENRVKYLGNIEAFNEVKIHSAQPKKITSIKADVNDVVKSGDVLATIENVEVKQALLQAEAGLSSAQAQLDNVNQEWERTKRLYEENAISKSQYDAVKTQKEAAEAGVKQAKAMLESTREQYENSFIKSPISGIVSQRYYDQGDQTSPQMPAFIVVDMEKVKIKVDIVEADLHHVKKGAKAYIVVKGQEDQQFIGNVNKVHPTVDPVTRTITAEIIINNKNLKLRPGMYAKVNIVTQSADEALLVPNHAIIEKTFRKWLGGEVSNAEIVVTKSCYIVKDGKAVKVDLKTGITDEENTQVFEGINPDDKLIVIGQHNIADGAKVKIAND